MAGTNRPRSPWSNRRQGETIGADGTSPYIGMRLLTVFAVCAALLAQTPQKGSQKPADEGLASITVDVNVVSVLTSVRDKKGALIPSLTKDDFTISEDG